jgi:hypothetical protein
MFIKNKIKKMTGKNKITTRTKQKIKTKNPKQKS